MIYEAIGRAVVKFGGRYVRTKYRRQLRIGAGLAAVAAVLAIAARGPQRPRGLAGRLRALPGGARQHPLPLIVNRSG